MSSPVPYLNPDHVTGCKQTDCPPNRSRTGYGNKLPTSWMLRIANRWHRVYVIQWSNMGSPYVLVRGEIHFLGVNDPRDFEGRFAQP